MAVYRPGNMGTIRGNPGYSIQEACVKLYEAMKGLGTDEAGVIDVITAHNFQERQQIQKKYQALYGKDLRKELDSELSFDFAKLVDSLMIDPEEYVMECIHSAISSKKKGGKLFKRFSSFFKGGLGASEYMLIGMLCVRSSEDLEAIKKAYKQRYKEELENKIAIDGNNMSHDVCSFIIDMISGEREADDKEWDDLDLDQLSDDCDELANCKSEDVLHALLQERSFTYLRRLFVECLKNVTGKSIENFVDDLKGQVSLELEEAYRAMIKLIVEGEAAYYAERAYYAIEGAGTDDDTLIKVVVHRSEIDLAEIIDIYEEKFKKELVADVKGDTSGDYMELLLKLLQKPMYEFAVLGETVGIDGEEGLNEEIKVEEKAGKKWLKKEGRGEVVGEKVETIEVENHVEEEKKEHVDSNGVEEQPEVKDEKVEVAEEKEVEKMDENVVCKEEKLEEKVVEDNKEGMITSEVVEEDEVLVVGNVEEVKSDEIREEEKGRDMEEVGGEVEEKGEENKEVECEIVKENEEGVKVPEMENEQEEIEGGISEEEKATGKEDEEKVVEIEKGELDGIKSVEECNGDGGTSEKNGEELEVEVDHKKDENEDGVVKENGKGEGSVLPEEF